MRETYSVRELFWTLQGEGSRAGEPSVFVRFAGCNLWDGTPEHRDRGAGACAKWCDTDFAKGEKVTRAQLLERMDALWANPGDVYGHRRWCVLTGGEPLLQVDDALVTALREQGWSIAIETNGTLNPPSSAWDAKGGSLLGRMQHVTVSPKLRADGDGWMPIAVRSCTDLKVVVPGRAALPGETWPPFGWTPDMLLEVAGEFVDGLEYLFVQPVDPVFPDSVGYTVQLAPTKTGEAKALFPSVAAAHDWRDGARVVHSNALAWCLSFLRSPIGRGWRLSMQLHKVAGLP